MGISVSRVGGSAQTKAMKQVAGNLRLDLASYRELQGFTQFGSDLDAATQHQLTHGSRMTELLKQPRFHALTVADQVSVLYAGNQGFLDDLEIEDVVPFRNGLLEYLNGAYGKLMERIGDTKIGDDLADQLGQAIADYKNEFLANKAAESPEASSEETEEN